MRVKTMVLFNDFTFATRVAELSKKTGLGGSETLFEQHGRNQLVAFISQGGFPNHKVLDAGCGTLRGGFWFITFLNKGNYFGLETIERHDNNDIENALEILFDKEVLDYKHPTFHYNDNFDYSPFNQKFDYIIMRSIWTHLGPNDVEKSLDSFCSHKTRKGILLTTYFRTMKMEEQYSKNEWMPDSARYTLEWIEKICEKRQLKVHEFHLDGCFGSPGISCSLGDNQTWLRIESV